MKRSEVIFYSVLVLSIFVFAACQVGPGEAVKRPKQGAVASQPVEDAISSTRQLLPCTNVGGACDFDSPPCCSGSSCINNTCQQQNQTNQTCTASTVCLSGTNLNVTTGNCTRYTTPCQYGCQIGSNACNAPPQNCTTSTICQGSYSNTTYSNCTSTRINCVYGCNSTSGNCYSTNQTQPPSCTPGWHCLNLTVTQYQQTNCTFTNLTTCQYGCNLTTKVCNSAPPGCTPSTQCVNSTFIQNFANCTSSSTNCASQNKTCNATLGCI